MDYTVRLLGAESITRSNSELCNPPGKIGRLIFWSLSGFSPAVVKIGHRALRRESDTIDEGGAYQTMTFKFSPDFSTVTVTYVTKVDISKGCVAGDCGNPVVTAVFQRR